MDLHHRRSKKTATYQYLCISFQLCIQAMQEGSLNAKGILLVMWEWNQTFLQLNADEIVNNIGVKILIYDSVKCKSNIYEQER